LAAQPALFAGLRVVILPPVPAVAVNDQQRSISALSVDAAAGIRKLVDRVAAVDGPVHPLNT
jgi:hypothetical protein